MQNAGISRTSVTHAALLIGAVPVLVAVIAAVWHHTVARPVAWLGFAISLAGVGLVTAGAGGGGHAGRRRPGAGLAADLGHVHRGPGPAAARAGTRSRSPRCSSWGPPWARWPSRVVAEGAPAAPAGPGPVLAVAALAAGGTLMPFTLFAYGQSRVSAEVAGAFLNLEPLVGAIAGVVFFANPVGPRQLAGGLGIVAGIGLSSFRPGSGGRRDKPVPRPRDLVRAGR